MKKINTKRTLSLLLVMVLIFGIILSFTAFGDHESGKADASEDDAYVSESNEDETLAPETETQALETETKAPETETQAPETEDKTPSIPDVEGLNVWDAVSLMEDNGFSAEVVFELSNVHKEYTVMSVTLEEGKAEEEEAKVTLHVCGDPSDYNGDINKLPIKIGSIGPLTEEAYLYGTYVNNGMMLAIEEINANGGIGGRQIKFRFEDDESKDYKALKAYKNLSDWGMDILAGPVTSGSTVAVSGSASQDKVFVITPTALLNSRSDISGSVFQLGITDANMGVVAARYIAEKMSDKKIAVICRKMDADSVLARDRFVAEAKKLNLNVVFSMVDVHVNPEIQYKFQMAKFKGADLIVVTSGYQTADAVIWMINDNNYFDDKYYPTVFSTDSLESVLLSTPSHNAYVLDGAMYLSTFELESEDVLTREFVKKYQAKYGEVPTEFAAEGYDCIYAIKKAYEEGGCEAKMTNGELRDALEASFKKITFDGVSGKSMTWNDQGEVIKTCAVRVAKDGKSDLVK